MSYQSVALDRAVDNWLSIEDVLVHKLIAGRARDREDVLSILATTPEFDEEYVADWAAAWEVAHLWEALEAEASTS